MIVRSRAGDRGPCPETFAVLAGGLPAGQPGGRRPWAGPRAAADRRPAHAGGLPHGAVADALPTVRTSQAAVTIKRAFEFLVLTAVRSGEVHLVTWDEMDLDCQRSFKIPPPAVIENSPTPG